MNMIRWRVIILLIVLVSSGCAAKQPPYNPYKIPEDQFRSTIKTVALSPIIVPDGLEKPDQVKAKFESLLDAKLRKLGFKVIPSSEYDAIWKKMMDKVGGYFDPVTGKRDDAKFKAVRTHTLREVNTKLKADAVVYSLIRVFPVPFNSNQASWHGTSESLVAGGALQKFFSNQFHGTVSALSFGVNISDPNEVDMYVNWGGIQVLGRVSGWQVVNIPPEEILTNEERNAAAVEIALDPLEKQPEPQPQQAPVSGAAKSK
jgi:hypothetical protein